MLSNANQARYRFCKLALCKTNIDVKVNKYGYTVFKKSRRKFQDGRSTKYFAIGKKIYDVKTTLILNHEYKKLPSAKNILGDFSCFVVIVLLAAPSKSHIEFSGQSDQVTAACLLAKQ